MKYPIVVIHALSKSRVRPSPYMFMHSSPVLQFVDWELWVIRLTNQNDLVNGFEILRRMQKKMERGTQQSYLEGTEHVLAGSEEKPTIMSNGQYNSCVVLLHHCPCLGEGWRLQTCLIPLHSLYAYSKSGACSSVPVCHFVFS